MQDNAKKFLKIAFGLPLTVISIAFISRFIYQHRTEIPTLEQIHWPVLFLGIGFLLVFYLIRSLVWYRIVKKYTKPSLTPLDSIYYLSLSELRRYIPGSVLSFVSRGVYFKPFGLSAKELPHLLVQEALIFVTSAAILSLPAYFYFQKYIPPGIATTIVPLFVIGTTVGIVYVIWRVRRLHIVKNLSEEDLKNGVINVAIGCLGWIFFGYGNFFVADSLADMNYYTAFYIISFFIFSWLVGFLAFITPMGLGVREGVIVFFLTKMFSVGIASAIALWSRLLIMVSEIIFLTTVFALRKFQITKYFKLSWQEIVALGISLGYIIYFSCITLAKHERFYTGKYDLGNMAHVLYHTSRGNIFQHTDAGGTEIVSRLATHADFILILLAPFSYVFDPSKFLLVFQSFALGIGVFLIYKIADLLLKNKNLALLFSVSYALNFWVQKQNLFDFHPVTLATPLVLGTFYYLFKKKIGKALFFLTLALLTKEQMWAVGFLIGGYIALIKKIKIGYPVMAFCIIAFYLLMTVFIPETKDGGHFALSYFNELGSTPTQIILNAIIKPHIMAQLLLSPDRIEYLKLVFMPLGILPLFSPVFLIGALPDLLINMVSNNSHLRDINYHYGAVIIPFTYLASISGVGFLIKKRTPVLLIGIYLTATILYASYQHGVLPGMKRPNVEMLRPVTNAEIELHTFLDSIPSHLDVSASNNVGPHLVMRDNIYVYPVGWDQAHVLVISKVDANATPNLESNKTAIAGLKLNPRFHVIFENDIAAAFIRRSIIAR